MFTPPEHKSTQSGPVLPTNGLPPVPGAGATNNYPYPSGPDLKSVGSHTSPLLVVGLVTLALALVQYIIAVLLVASANSNLATLERKKSDASQAIVQLKEVERQAVAFQEGLKNFTQIVNSRVDVEKFFSTLESSILTNAKYQSVGLDESKSVKLDGLTKDFESVAKQLVALRSAKELAGVKLDAVSKNDSGVQFSISASLSGQSKAVSQDQPTQNQGGAQ